MTTSNEQLRDLAIARQVRVLRLSRRHERILTAILARALVESRRELARRLVAIEVSGLDRGPYTTNQIRQTIRVLSLILGEAYGRMGQELPRRLLALADSEAAAAGEMIRTALPAAIGFDLAMPSSSLLRTIATKQAIQGGPLGAYFKKRGKRSLTKKLLIKYRNLIENAIATGLLRTKGVDAVTRSIHSQAQRLARWQLRSVVDTATKQVAQASRMAFLEENAGPDGLVKGYQWLSTLDLHTTKEYCIPRDGKVYDTDLSPIGHGFEWGAGPGAIHWGCRSTMTSILKSWEELGIAADELSGGTRASMDGQIPRETTAQKWFESRDWTKKELEQVFGKRRAQRIKDGDLTVGGALRQFGVKVTE